jgi:riboflavin synthase
VIPETARQTTILKKDQGDWVNIETDLIAKYIEKFISKERITEKDATVSRIDREMLRRYGFGDTSL